MSNRHQASSIPPGRVGTIGKRVTARTNAFALSWDQRGVVYHYDVAMSPSWSNPTESDKNFGTLKSQEIIKRLQTDVDPMTFHPRGAFDGRKNLFSTTDYRIQTQRFEVPLNAGQRSNPKKVSVKIAFVRKVNVGLLDRLLRGEGTKDDLQPEGDVSTTLNMLNVFIQAMPKVTSPHNARSFFPDGQEIKMVRGLELRRGYFQSVRLTFDRIIVNVDVNTGIIVPKKRLDVLCAEYLRCTPYDLVGLNDGRIQELRHFLKGVKVISTLHPGKRPKSIKSVTGKAGEETFERDGEVTTVGRHFLEVHNVKVRPKSLGVVFGSGEIFPMSHCETTGYQLYKKHLPPDMMSTILAFSTSRPAERLRKIQQGWNLLQYDSSDFVSGAGIRISPDPLYVNARILPSHFIDFGGQGDSPLHQKIEKPGEWDVKNRRLIAPATIQRWVVINLTGEYGKVQEIINFVDALGMAMKNRGMKVPPPAGMESGDPFNTQKILHNAMSSKPHFILAFLPQSAAEPYNQVKRFGDISTGIVTQCIKWTGQLSPGTGRCDQYLNNLILKINLKLGGLNYIYSSPAMDGFRQVPTMVMGADVSHAGPGSDRPSIAALVSSFDPYACRYAASIKVQAPRTEIIVELREMVERAITIFIGKNNRNFPQRIIYYRDGVSESEFERVDQVERTAITQACRASFAKAYPGKDVKKPKLSFIVVGKRHHIRFFPNERDQDRTGNCEAGFVVDRDIVHPVYNDFYLQSHAGLKGTSRPSHYTVLHDDLFLSADSLQEFSYSLCHCYLRATRSVSIPAPVYYADLVCRRAKFHFDSFINYEDTASIDSDESYHLDHYQKHFDEVAARLKDSMYFV